MGADDEDDQGEWHVVLQPVSDDDLDDEGVNTNGLGVFVSNGLKREPVARIAYVRRNSVNPDDEFREVVQRMVATAQDTCDMLNATIEDILDSAKTEDVS